MTAFQMTKPASTSFLEKSATKSTVTFFKGTYIIAVPPSLTPAARFTATGGVGYDPDGVDFSILRVSKTLSQEPIGVLYAESIFEFYLNFSEDGPCTQYAIKVTGRMMKLKYHMFGLGAPFQSPFDLSRLSRPYLENMKDICDSTIDHFTSTDITRHSMQIILRVTRELDDTLSSPLFLAMNRLEGFRTVRVELRSSLPIFERKDPQHASDHLNEGLQSVEAHLEPSWDLLP